MPDVDDLGFVEDFVVEAQNPLIFLVSQVVRWRHSDGRENRNFLNRIFLVSKDASCVLNSRMRSACWWTLQILIFETWKGDGRGLNSSPPCAEIDARKRYREPKHGNIKQQTQITEIELLTEAEQADPKIKRPFRMKTGAQEKTGYKLRCPKTRKARKKHG